MLTSIILEAIAARFCSLTNASANVDAKQQPEDEDYFDINGSSIAYIPPSGTQLVIYKFTYFSSWVNDWTIFHHKLFIDSTEVVTARQQFGHGYKNENYVIGLWPYPKKALILKIIKDE